MFEQETSERKPYEGKIYDEAIFGEKNSSRKFATQTLTPKSERVSVSGPRSRTPEDPRQRRLMHAALGLLLVALCFVFLRDRDFWFPNAQDAELNEPAETIPAAAGPASMPAPVASAPVTAPEAKSKRHIARANTTPSVNINVAAAAPAQSTESDPPPAVVSNRTVLPPLDVEVVAGDRHRTIRPGTNSIRVDLQPGVKAQSTNQPTTEVHSAAPADNTPVAPEASESAADVTSNASERVQMSASTEEVVSHPVKPGYPVLARQMKVQGAVVLRALIGKDGVIQDLHLVSGPGILASAAQDAVRQWHFKPHYVDDVPVETQARITVNFTISTN